MKPGANAGEMAKETAKEIGKLRPMLLLGMIALAAGLFFKVAAVPFHMWAPDVYEGAPTSVTAFLSTGSKAASFALYARIFMEALPSMRVDWAPLLGLVAAITIMVGNWAAVTQENSKRLLAYSSISNAGYLLLGLVAGVGAFLLLQGHVRLWSAAIAGWNAFAAVILALDWMTIRTMPQRKIRERAQQEDLSRLLVFIFVVVASFAALCAVVFFVRVHKGQMHQHFLIHLLLTLSTVISAWALLHTVYSFRYAHAFYGDSGEPGVQKDAGGLIFPGDQPPNYFDFAYFSFVVGMTCQVSDVQITSRRMRRITLVHSVLSFGFNTLILALLINTVSGLL